MALSAFDDKSNQPQASDLMKTLGRAGAHWDNLVAHIASEYPPLDQTWIFSGAKWGWSLRLKQKKRTILYMTPCKGYFIAGFALGAKAVEAAHDSALSDTVLLAIDGATKYAEGRAVRLEIRNKKDFESVKILCSIKMAN